MKAKYLSGMVLVLVLVLVLMLTGNGQAEQQEEAKTLFSAERESLTENFFGAGDKLEDGGITVGLFATQIYQQNVRGGLSTHRRTGRYTGSFDLELTADLEKLLGMEGARTYLLAEGSWPEVAGITEPAVGSYFGVNDDATSTRVIDITEFWFEQKFGSSWIVRVGKVDLTGGFECGDCPVSFDGNLYANDETRQFLNSALVNNPTVPFPDYGLAALVYYNPVEWWYASVGAADGQADVRETGINTTFHGEDYFFGIFETGIVPQIPTAKGPLPGSYLFGVWYDPQDKERFSSGSIRRDDTGFYASFSQQIYRENSELTDRQGLGAFARWGWADSEVNEVNHFWSVGAQYQGLIPGRDDDVLAAGVAQGIFTDENDAGFTKDAETVTELYYNAQLAGWVNLSPSVQYISRPAGNSSAGDAIVLGMRMQMSF